MTKDLVRTAANSPLSTNVCLKLPFSTRLGVRGCRLHANNPSDIKQANPILVNLANVFIAIAFFAWFQKPF
jgi:hypothetical protein